MFQFTKPFNPNEITIEYNETNHSQNETKILAIDVIKSNIFK